MELRLYMFETCPFCRKVIREIEKEGRTDIRFHNIHESEDDLRTLVDVGGEKQVPCLFIDGKPLYESDDIIKWLKDNPQT